MLGLPSIFDQLDDVTSSMMEYVNVTNAFIYAPLD